jgi:hypothetical protein
MTQIATKLYDATSTYQVDYCMQTAAEYYHSCLRPDDPYLAQRGISYATAQRYMLGRAQGKQSLRQHLKAKGFTDETIQQTDLLNSHGDDRFQDHLLVPIHLGDRVVDFYGRYLSAQSRSERHWRLPNAGRPRSHFNWDMERTDMILVEGAMDALALIEHGFDNAVATGGTGGLDRPLIRRAVAVGLKRVWMCFDGDEAGCQRNLSLAYELANLGLRVKIITLPTGQDPNDFMLSHTAADFRELIGAAVMPEQWEIARVPDNLDKNAQIEALEGVMTRINGLPAMTKASLIEMISKKTGVSKQDVKHHVEQLAKESNSVASVDFAEYECIHPALHFGTRETLITYPFFKEDWESWVITSNRELFRLSQDELHKRGYHCQHLVASEQQQFSPGIIKEFLDGSRADAIADVFCQLRDMIKAYCDFSDPYTYDYLAAWIIGTYFFPIFNYYPYLHFTGTKEVGKSKTIKLMSLLCWNGKHSVSMSDAAMFRIISEALPTLFLDESEHLNDKTPTERRALLLGGFEKGTKVNRVETVNGTYRVKTYDNYCPRVFGSINGMDDTLASRSVQIAMSRSFKDCIKENEVHLLDERFRDVRDKLFLAIMTYGNSVRTIYEQMPKPDDIQFDAREWNLFKPIYAIGCLVGSPDVLEHLIEFANARYAAKTDSMNDTAAENVILRFLLEKVQTEDEHVLDDLHKELIAFQATPALLCLRRGFGIGLDDFGVGQQGLNSMYFGYVSEVDLVSSDFLGQRSAAVID